MNKNINENKLKDNNYLKNIPESEREKIRKEVISHYGINIKEIEQREK